MQQFYYPKTIRALIVAVLDVFNDLKIERYDSSGTKVKDVNVPISFAPQEKQHLLRLRKGAPVPSAFKSSPIPRLGLSMGSPSYAQERATSVNELRKFYDKNDDIKDLDSVFRDMQPAPYNFPFTLSVFTNSLTDYSQIMENILPYFNPAINLRVKEISFLNIERDIPFILESINTDFLTEIQEDTDRYINATLDFMAKGFMYRPISTSKIIKKINVDYNIGNQVSLGDWDNVENYRSVEIDNGGISGTNN